MKNFNEYNNILNTPIDMKQKEPSFISIDKKYNYIVESVGGLEKYKNLERLGYDYKSLYESNLIQYVEKKSKEPEFSDLFGGQISQTIVTLLVEKFIQPWVEKDGGIQKYSLVWYMLTYGIVESIFKLIKQTLDKEKEIDFCVIIASGVVEGFQAWASLSVIKSFLKLMGVGKDKIDFFNNSVTLNVIAQHLRASLLNGLNDQLVEDILCNWSKGTVMGELFDGIGKGITSAKDYIIELID